MGGKARHLHAEETSTCKTELRNPEPSHSKAVAWWLTLLVQREVWIPALAPGTVPAFHTTQSLPKTFLGKS